MKGIIIVNPFLVPKESIFQAERLKTEFNLLGVEVEIVSNVFLNTVLAENKLNSKFSNVDFAVYLDKDKYQSEILEKLGVRLFNNHNAIRVCDDKAQTYIALSNNKITMPKTIFGALCYNKECKIDDAWLTEIENILSYPIIVKESFGSMGKGVYKADNRAELCSIMEAVKLKPHFFQEYIDKVVGIDVRVIVIGGKCVCAMERVNNNDFRSNVAQGGTGRNVELSKEFISVAERCACILGLDYCGVDLLYGVNNTPVVCEVNSNAFIGGIEATTGINVANLYAEYIINSLKK